jgi:hypothetical protein
MVPGRLGAQRRPVRDPMTTAVRQPGHTKAKPGKDV